MTNNDGAFMNDMLRQIQESLKRASRLWYESQLAEMAPIEISSSLKRELAEASHFFAEQLDIRGFVVNCMLERLPSHIGGTCFQHPVTKDIYVSLDPKPFAYPLIEVLAHEMVHAAQYANGHLNIIKLGEVQLEDGSIKVVRRTTFRGKIYDLMEGEERFAPWEQEAYALQGPLADMWYKVRQMRSA